MNTTLSAEAVKSAAASAPPVTVAGVSLAGVALNDWVYILTIIWLVMQMVWFVVSKVRSRPASADKE